MIPKRPLVRYHGGKFVLADWIISHFPPHRIYCEPFGGGGSVLLKKPRSYAEIYNDLDERIVTVFKAARDDGPELLRLIRRTPFSRQIFNETYEPSKSTVEQAAKFIFRSFSGFGSAAITSMRGKTGFRANSNRSGTTPAHDWRNYARHFFTITKRLHGVVIENRDALELMLSIDSESTLFYIDPPYFPDTRWNPKELGAYKHEMSIQQHEHLCDVLLSLKGFVVLSGYDNEIYASKFSGWTKSTRQSLKSSNVGGIMATETLWINTACSKALGNMQDLFTEARA